jgi:hypothetical protein
MTLGIKSVGDILAQPPDERIHEISTLSPKERISESKLKTFHAKAIQSLAGPPSPKTDYQTMVNAYLAKCGKDYWEGQVKSFQEWVHM